MDIPEDKRAIVQNCFERVKDVGITLNKLYVFRIFPTKFRNYDIETVNR